jgi:hypothetical protein
MVPVLLKGSESWPMKTKDKTWTQAVEMKFLRSVKDCSKIDRIRNEDIRMELDIFSLNPKIEEN